MQGCNGELTVQSSWPQGRGQAGQVPSAGIMLGCRTLGGGGVGEDPQDFGTGWYLQFTLEALLCLPLWDLHVATLSYPPRPCNHHPALCSLHPITNIQALAPLHPHTLTPASLPLYPSHSTPSLDPLCSGGRLTLWGRQHFRSPHTMGTAPLPVTSRYRDGTTSGHLTL